MTTIRRLQGPPLSRTRRARARARVCVCVCVRVCARAYVRVNALEMWQNHFVDGDLAESIKRSASDRLGDLVPLVRAQTFPGFSHDIWLLGI